jgi:hypothetical protein
MVGLHLNDTLGGVDDAFLDEMHLSKKATVWSRIDSQILECEELAAGMRNSLKKG